MFRFRPLIRLRSRSASMAFSSIRTVRGTSGADTRGDVRTSFPVRGIRGGYPDELGRRFPVALRLCQGDSHPDDAIVADLARPAVSLGETLG
jgi:hypothetical protein